MPPTSTRVVGVAMMTALATALAYSTVALPNVSLMDVVVFVAGWTMGAGAGAAVGCLSWVVYGVLNPYGFNPVVWIATMTSEALYGLAGGLVKKVLPPHHIKLREALLLGGLGFLSTFTYDILTNLAFAFVFNIPLLIALAMGIPFALVHELSNLVIFTSAAPPMVKAFHKVSPLMGVVRSG